VDGTMASLLVMTASLRKVTTSLGCNDGFTWANGFAVMDNDGFTKFIIIVTDLRKTFLENISEAVIRAVK